MLQQRQVLNGAMQLVGLKHELHIPGDGGEHLEAFALSRVGNWRLRLFRRHGEVPVEQYHIVRVPRLQNGGGLDARTGKPNVCHSVHLKLLIGQRARKF